MPKVPIAICFVLMTPGFISATASVSFDAIGTAKLNGLDPEAYLRDVLMRIADHPINQIRELLPWNSMQPAGPSGAGVQGPAWGPIVGPDRPLSQRMEEWRGTGTETSLASKYGGL